MKITVNEATRLPAGADGYLAQDMSNQDYRVFRAHDCIFVKDLDTLTKHSTPVDKRHKTIFTIKDVSGAAGKPVRDFLREKGVYLDEYSNDIGVCIGLEMKVWPLADDKQLETAQLVYVTPDAVFTKKEYSAMSKKLAEEVKKLLPEGAWI